MVEVRWAPQAIDDINNIAEYIAKDSIKYAKIQSERFFEATEILLTRPSVGRIVPEVNKPNIRELILGNYRIIYKIISTNRIDILTIHHSARRIKKSKLK